MTRSCRLKLRPRWLSTSQLPRLPHPPPSSPTPRKDGLVGSFGKKKTLENINNESFKTSSAITHRNLYITTKSLVTVHQGICYCHTVQLPSSYNCYISMPFCKTTTILAVGFFFSFKNPNRFFSTVSRKAIKTYIHTTLLFARGATECTSTFCRIVFARSCGVGRGEEVGEERSSLMLLVGVSGSEERSQNTHGEQPG